MQEKYQQMLVDENLRLRYESLLRYNLIYQDTKLRILLHYLPTIHQILNCSIIRIRVIPSLLLSRKGLVKTVQFKNPKYIGDPINAE